MTIPRIEIVRGSRNTENIVLMCTGCEEYYTYSVRQYKGDFGCNITEFKSFLDWAKWDAARHECFEAGSRTGYIVKPPSELARHASQPERHEDPWGEEAMSGYVPWLDEDDDELHIPPGEVLDEDDDDLEDAWEDLGVDWETLDIDEEEEPYVIKLEGRLPDPSEFESPTGRLPRTLREQMQDPGYIFELRPLPEVPPEYVKKIVIAFDYASLEQRIFEALAEDAGIYTRDAQGHLRDEKGRCLACLRPGVHR